MSIGFGFVDWFRSENGTRKGHITDTFFWKRPFADFRKMSVTKYKLLRLKWIPKPIPTGTRNHWKLKSKKRGLKYYKKHAKGVPKRLSKSININPKNISKKVSVIVAKNPSNSPSKRKLPLTILDTVIRLFGSMPPITSLYSTKLV